jgi:protein-disulfide isomerase
LPTVKRILEQYQAKARFVFRDSPLRMHREAVKAAEATACANEQGRF